MALRSYRIVTYSWADSVVGALAVVRSLDQVLRSVLPPAAEARPRFGHYQMGCWQTVVAAAAVAAAAFVVVVVFAATAAAAAAAAAVVVVAAASAAVAFAAARSKLAD